MKKHKIPESSPLYSFADKLKALRDKENLSNKQLKERIESHLGYEFSEATLNNWLQHFSFPEYDKLVAICKVFPPYSVDFFMGVINDAPSYDHQFIMQEIGLSPDAIENLKKLSSEHTDTLNHFLESETFNSIIGNIDAGKEEGERFKDVEYETLNFIYDYLDVEKDRFWDISYEEYERIDDSDSMALSESEYKLIETRSFRALPETEIVLDNSDIESLKEHREWVLDVIKSNYGGRKTIPELKIDQYKMNTISVIQEYFEQNTPSYCNKDEKLKEYLKIYNEKILPDNYTIQYFENVISPLRHEIWNEICTYDKHE